MLLKDLINSPIFEVVLPSTGAKIQMRPWLVGEERILYMALETESSDEMAKAFKQILERCLITKVDIDRLAPFDLETLFLRIREKSVGEKAELLLNLPPARCKNPEYQEKKLGCAQKVVVNLSEIELKRDPNHQKKIDVGNGIIVVMRYPTTELLNKLSDATKVSDAYGAVISVVAKCIELVCVGEEVIETDNNPIEDVISFLESMTKMQLELILEFFRTIPVLKKDLAWKCGTCGADLTYEVRGLQSFFTLASATAA